MDMWAYAAMGAALAAGAVVKGATGMGLPLVALPALTAVFGLQHALCIIMLPILVTNVWQLWRFRAVRHAPAVGFVPALVGGGVAGVAMGTWLLITVPERQLMIGLGLLLFAYIALRLARPAFRVDAEAGRRWAVPVGVAAGTLQGATGISAPIGVTFIHAMKLERDAHVYAVSAMFFGFAVVQVAALILSGVMRLDWALQGVVALLPTLAFLPVGQWLAGKLSAAAFDRLILIFLGAIGIKLIAGI